MARLAENPATRPVPGADDLDVLHPRRSVLVAGELWELREFTLREGFAYAHHAANIEAARAEGRDPAPEFYYLLGVCTGKAAMRIAGLKSEDLHRLTEAWRKLNEAWLSPEPPEARKRRGEPMRWSTAYALLISNGHSQQDIHGYTLRQVQLYLNEIDRLTMRLRIARTFDVNQGMAGGEKAKQYTRDLGKIDETERLLHRRTKRDGNKSPAAEKRRERFRRVAAGARTIEQIFSNRGSETQSAGGGAEAAEPKPGS